MSYLVVPLSVEVRCIQETLQRPLEVVILLFYTITLGQHLFQRPEQWSQLNTPVI